MRILALKGASSCLRREMKTGFMDVISSDEKVLGNTCAPLFVSRIGKVAACESVLQINENN